MRVDIDFYVFGFLAHDDIDSIKARLNVGDILLVLDVVNLLVQLNIIIDGDSRAAANSWFQLDWCFKGGPPSARRVYTGNGGLSPVLS